MRVSRRKAVVVADFDEIAVVVVACAAVLDDAVCRCVNRRFKRRAKIDARVELFAL